MIEMLYWLIRGIGCGVYKANAEQIRIDARNAALKDGKDIYFDGDGHMWYCGHGYDERCREVFNYNIYTGQHTIIDGHHVIISEKTGKVLKDYTLERMKNDGNTFNLEWNNAIETARNNGNKYFYFGNSTQFGKIAGYYDLETKKKYKLFKNLSVDKNNNEYVYYIRYYNTTKEKEELESTKEITKEIYEQYGGDFVFEQNKGGRY